MGIWFHFLWIATVSSAAFVALSWSWERCLWISSYMCSIGLRPGLRDGQSSVWTLFWWKNSHVNLAVWARRCLVEACNLDGPHVGGTRHLIDVLESCDSMTLTWFNILKHHTFNFLIQSNSTGPCFSFHSTTIKVTFSVVAILVLNHDNAIQTFTREKYGSLLLIMASFVSADPSAAAPGIESSVIQLFVLDSSNLWGWPLTSMKTPDCLILLSVLSRRYPKALHDAHVLWFSCGVFACIAMSLNKEMVSRRKKMNMQLQLHYSCSSWKPFSTCF